MRRSRKKNKIPHNLIESRIVGLMENYDTGWISLTHILFFPEGKCYIWRNAPYFRDAFDYNPYVDFSSPWVCITKRSSDPVDFDIDLGCDRDHEVIVKMTLDFVRPKSEYLGPFYCHLPVFDPWKYFDRFSNHHLKKRIQNEQDIRLRMILEEILKKRLINAKKQREKLSEKEHLQKYSIESDLEQAVAREDYEKAAQLRDLLQKKQ